jgi:hypothetical protein
MLARFTQCANEVLRVRDHDVRRGRSDRFAHLRLDS